MRNLKFLAICFATSVLACSVSAQEINNWRSSNGDVWKNSAGECWRNSSWTPATAAPGCDPSISAAPKSAPAAGQPAAASKVTYAADAFFDFDKSVLKPEGKAKLDDLISKIKSINLEVIIAVGHTDSVGTDAYNQKLSVRRSDAVKAYLVSKGIEKNRVYTEGKGKSQPVADNNTADGRSKNRRVEIEVVGTRSK
jgi:OOP family OmpA-OmpF porin